MEQEKLTNKEYLNIFENFKKQLIIKTSEINLYDWDDKFKSNHLKKLREDLLVYFNEIDYAIFGIDELKQLGFSVWDDEESDPIYLAPLWTYDTFKGGTKLYSIGGGEKIVGIDDLDNDHRYGNLAYGLKESQIIKAIRNKKVNELLDESL